MKEKIDLEQYCLMYFPHKNTRNLERLSFEYDKNINLLKDIFSITRATRLKNFKEFIMNTLSYMNQDFLSFIKFQASVSYHTDYQEFYFAFTLGNKIVEMRIDLNFKKNKLYDYNDATLLIHFRYGELLDKIECPDKISYTLGSVINGERSYIRLIKNRTFTWVPKYTSNESASKDLYKITTEFVNNIK